MSSYNYKEGLGVGVWGLKGDKQRDKTRTGWESNSERRK